MNINWECVIDVQTYTNSISLLFLSKWGRGIEYFKRFGGALNNNSSVPSYEVNNDAGESWGRLLLLGVFLIPSI